MSNSLVGSDFQRILDAQPQGAILKLDHPLEKAGPINICKHITLDGQGKAAIWSQTSPVVTIQAARTALHNLRVEYTGEDINACAIQVLGKDVELKNVTVRGNILGLVQESGIWRYPHQIYLGKLKPDCDIRFRLRLVTPVACQLSSGIDGVTIEPATLPAGLHEVHLSFDGMRKDTLIYGVLIISTPGLRREIVINGHVVPRNEAQADFVMSDTLLWQPLDWDALKLPKAKPLPIKPPSNPNPSISPASSVVPTITKSTKLIRNPAVLGELFSRLSPQVPDSSSHENKPPTSDSTPLSPPPTQAKKRKSIPLNPLFGTPEVPPSDESTH